MKIDKPSPLIEEYLLYLTTIKSRSLNTIIEYKIDLTLFFVWLSMQRTLPALSAQQSAIYLNATLPNSLKRRKV